MGRRLLGVALIVASGWPLGRLAWGDVWNIEAVAGRGLTAANLATDQLWAPWYGTMQLAYLPLEVGSLSLGPVVALNLGAFETEDTDELRLQVGQAFGWQCYSRPTADWGWNAVATFNIVEVPVLAMGLELGGTAAYFLTAGIGLTAGLRYSFYYGVDGVHVFAAQVGVLLSYEVIR